MWVLLGVTLFLVVLIRLGMWVSVPYFVAKERFKDHHRDMFFVDPRSPDANAAPIKFPSTIDEEPTKYLSMIVPAYQEELRLGKMLVEALDALEGLAKTQQDFSYEIIVVDDGSRDNTTGVALEFARQRGADSLRVMTLERNLGKGGAVQRVLPGMLHARGRYLLFADADGATHAQDIGEVLARMRQVERSSMGVVVGSRAHLEDKAIATRKWYRNVLMWGFHLVVWLFAVKTVRDTQCGFKLFTRDTAALVFANQHIHGWAFDAELLFIAEAKKVPIAEVSVHWEEIPGSKLSLLWASLSMARELFVLWLCYSLGVWKIDSPLQARHRRLSEAT